MIYIVIFLVVVALFIKAFTLKHVLDNVTYSIKSEKSVVEPGESFSVTTTLKNGKRMPVMFIRLEELIPTKMQVEGASQQFYAMNDKSRLVSSTYLMPYQKFTRVFNASIPDRGRYFLHGATLKGGDIFGIGETVEYVTLLEEIVVLPKAVSCGKLETVLGGFLGDFSVNRFIMEDPILTIGFRDYTGREPMKHINWAQSLKANKLMVKNFDHTTDLSATVILNIECGEDGREINSALMENAFSVARFVCEHLEQKNVKYSFFTNATAAGAVGHWKSVGEGLGHRHLYTILEGLGRATYDSTAPFTSILEKAAHVAERGRAHIVITPQIESYWQSAFKRLSVAADGKCLLISADKYMEEKEEN